MMNHLGKSAFFVACCLVCSPSVAGSDGTTTMYKLVDSQGRVTYSNTPIAGAVRVALEPITVLINTVPATTTVPQRPQLAAVTPAVTSAIAAAPLAIADAALAEPPDPSAVAANVLVATATPVMPKLSASTKPTTSRLPVPTYTATEIISPTLPVATPPMQVAVVTPVAHPKIKHLPLPTELLQTAENATALKTAPSLTLAPIMSTSPVATAKLTPVAIVTTAPSKQTSKQAAKLVLVSMPSLPLPRDEVKLTAPQIPSPALTQVAIDSTQRLLAAAKTALDEENSQSEGVRAIKATFNASAKNSVSNGNVNNADVKLVQVPVLTAEARQKVVRHFDRIRDLQDEIAAHEKTLDDLRRELTTGKSDAANTTERKTAKLATASNLH